MHTPGPWEIDFETGELSTSDVVIGTIYGVEYLDACPDKETTQEIKDTAALIQHAPELLYACREIFAILTIGANPDVDRAACIAANAIMNAIQLHPPEIPEPGVMGPDKKADMLT